MSLIKRIFLYLSVIIAIADSYAQSIHRFAPSSVLAEGRWIKIALDGKEDGVYQITYRQLRDLGFKNFDNVGVYGFGGHVLTEDFSKGHIDDLPEIATYHDIPNERILFFGQGLISWEYDSYKGFRHTQNPYANKACYFIHEKEDKALSMEVKPNGNRADEEVSTSDVYLLHELELTNIGKTGREMYGESFLHTQSQLISFNESLNTGKCKLTAKFAALSSAQSSFTIKHNNNIVATANLSGTSNAYTYATESTVEEYFDIESEDPVSFRINYNASGNVKNAHLNYIILEGRQDIGIDNDISFKLFRNTKSINSLLKYNISSFVKGRHVVWDISNPLNISLQEISDNGSFIASSTGLTDYALVDLNSKKINGVTIIGQIENQNLHGIKSGDMVIVVPNGLKTYAQKLADYRQTHDKMSVLVVTPEQIYNEYSSGTADATAIRLFMKQVFSDKNTGAKRDGYLLLFGDGHYDNRKIDGSPNYLISYQTSTSLNETSSTVCDDYFGFLDDNEGGKKDYNGNYSISSDIVDIGIGRIPVHTATDAESVINKIIDYSNNSHYGTWKNRLCFLSDDDKISDDATDSPNAHMKHNDQVIDIIQNQQKHKEFIYQKIYLPSYSQTTTASGTDYPDAKKQFMEYLQQGVLMVNYAGHGASNSITHEMLMTTSKAAQLNMKNLPLWITASCDISRWDNDDESMGEALLLNKNGGAIALISTVRVVYAHQNLSLNLAIARNIFNRKDDGSKYRLGDVLKAAKQSLGSDFNKLNFCLLGDPSMTLAYPEYKMEISEIDYGEKVTLKGRVISPETGRTAEDFNGLVYPIIYGMTDSITADKGPHQDPVYKFASRTKKVFSGRDFIRSGKFEVSFITPIDASTSSSNGLVNLYACDENNNEANGFYEGIDIIKSSSTAICDTIGPEITKIFVNSSDFKNGDNVGPTPYFYAEIHDESGFNVTGNNIGHDATLTIRCTSNSILSTRQYSLNEYLTTFTEDPTTGNIRFIIPELESGDYELTFKIWDSFNNSSTSTIKMAVSEKQQPIPILIQAYPSPIFQGEMATIRVLHKLPESPTTIKLQIYTETGVKIHETVAQSSTSDIVYLEKDAKSPTDFNTSINADESSNFWGASTLKWTASVTPGIYVYKVYISSGNSEVATGSKLILVK